MVGALCQRRGPIRFQCTVEEDHAIVIDRMANVTDHSMNCIPTLLVEHLLKGLISGPFLMGFYFIFDSWKYWT